MLKGFPCLVTDCIQSKPSEKRGIGKVTIVGVDIFTSQKYEDTAPMVVNLNAPIINKEEL